jgi:murein L,D-transpeptidase YafK
VPITNNFIKKLYVIAVETKDNGQNNIPVHVFPFIMNDQNMREFSELLEYKEVKDFWENIREGYVYFERYHKLPRISVNKNGKYIFR